jgi:hypothetical protein
MSRGEEEREREGKREREREGKREREREGKRERERRAEREREGKREREKGRERERREERESNKNFETFNFGSLLHHHSIRIPIAQGSQISGFLQAIACLNAIIKSAAFCCGGRGRRELKH